VPPVERYLEQIVEIARAVLGDDLVGVYTAGSLALGAFDASRSDIDVALVSGSALEVADKREVVARLRHEALPCPARGLELVVYRREVAGSARPDAAFEMELNTGQDMAFRATERPGDRPEEDGSFWYGLDRDILHSHGAALTGPPAGHVFAGLADDDVRALLLDSLVWWWRRTPPQPTPTPGAEEAVLGGCRALVRHRHDTWLAKVAAARRFLAEGGTPSGLLEQSIRARSGGPPPSGSDARVFLEQVRLELARAVR
jgi:hypothetical protein